MDAATTTAKPHAHGPSANDGEPPTVAAEGGVVYLDPDRSVSRFVSEAWHGRRLVGSLVLYLLSRMYARTYLGRAWLFMRPGMDVLGGALLFGGVLSVSSEDGTPYLLFLAAGILGWRLFERTVIWVTRSFDRVRPMKKVDLPLLLVPIAGAAPALVDALAYLVLLVAIALGYLVVDGRMWLALDLETLAAVGGLALCLVFGISIGLWTSILNAHTRDVKHFMRYFLQIWMFATPVIYPITRLPESVRPIAQANPMAAPIELVKHGLLGSGNVQLVPVLWSCTAACLFVGAGLWFFSRRASNFMGPAGWGDEDEEDEGGFY